MMASIFFMPVSLRLKVQAAPITSRSRARATAAIAKTAGFRAAGRLGYGYPAQRIGRMPSFWAHQSDCRLPTCLSICDEHPPDWDKGMEGQKCNPVFSGLGT